MDSSQESDGIPEENAVTSSAIEPLLNLGLGASEEVNTSSNFKENAEKTSYTLRNKTTDSNNKTNTDSSEDFCHTTPLNSPIVSGTTSQSQPQTTEIVEQQNVQNASELQVRVIPSTEGDLNVFCSENLQLIQVQSDSHVSNGESAETPPIPGGFVMIEQSVLEQISGFLKNAAMVPGSNVAKATSQATPTSNVTTKAEQVERPNSTTNGATPCESKAEEEASGQEVTQPDEDEWIDTKATALQLMEELRRYHIPQAVFAKKVLNRSQGTLSDILRKPKPWNEMRLGKEIFRKMKQWLSLPEVKRIPQLRTEAAKELDSRHKKHISSESNDDGNDTPKKARRQFTESQKRSLFAIFRETKKPPKEMQRAIAEELGLDLTTVANFFMNARRRHATEEQSD